MYQQLKENTVKVILILEQLKYDLSIPYIAIIKDTAKYNAATTVLCFGGAWYVLLEITCIHTYIHNCVKTVICYFLLLSSAFNKTTTIAITTNKDNDHSTVKVASVQS